MIQIMRKEGFILNPNDKVINAILSRCEKNNGICPCHHPEEEGDLHCSCESYRLKKIPVVAVYILNYDYYCFKL